MATGSQTKTVISVLLQQLEENIPTAEKPCQVSNTYITDGNAMYHAQVAFPSTFGEPAECLFEQLPKEKCVLFVTYSYHTLSVKGIERETGEGH